MEWKYQVLLLHPPADGRLHWWFGTIMNNPSMSICVWVWGGNRLSFFWSGWPRVESLGHRLTLCLLFREIAFPKQQHHLTFPPAMHADAISAHPCSPLLLSGGCESCLTVVVTCISLTTNGVEQLFVCLLAVCLSSLDVYLFRFLCPLFHWVMCLLHQSPFTD